MRQVDPESDGALRHHEDFHKRLREEGQVAHVEQQDYYLVGGYEAVKEVMVDHDRFTKSYGNQLAPMEPNYALNQDPPQFSAFRSLYTRYMSPAGVKRWTNDCHEIANRLIDGFEGLGSGDLQPLFAKPLPAEVTAIALGLPRGQVDRYRAWTDAFLSNMIADPAEQARIIGELYSFFDQQFEVRRRVLEEAGIDSPKPEHVGSVLSDDLNSVLMVTPYLDRHLTNDELRRTVRGFFVGGVDTTGALILNVLNRLLEVQERWEQVRADHSLIEKAIDETLRIDPPTIGMFRGTTCPVSMGSETIPEGSRVLYSILSANRDPVHFADPDTFRLDRKDRSPVLSFGSGAHFCPGAWTARLEAKVALQRLVERLPRLRRTGDLAYFKASNFRIVSSFPAAWD